MLTPAAAGAVRATGSSLRWPAVAHGADGPPRPPALDTAAASSADVHVHMGARMIGSSMPKRSQRGVLNIGSTPGGSQVKTPAMSASLVVATAPKKTAPNGADGSPADGVPLPVSGAIISAFLASMA